MVQTVSGARIDPRSKSMSIVTEYELRSRQTLEDTGDLKEEIKDGVQYLSAMAFIKPYAIIDEIQNILNGIHTDHLGRFLNLLPELIRSKTSEFFMELLAEINGIGPATIKKIETSMKSSKRILNNSISELIHSEIQGCWIRRRQKFRRIAARLPMIELAEFAKTLVSLQAEVVHYLEPVRSVGGPIDVATITKEHGVTIHYGE